MLIDTMLEYLKSSELAGTWLEEMDNSEPGNEETALVARARIYGYINRALAEMNKIFDLNQGVINITLHENKCKYFISDRSLVKILEVYDKDGVELPLNKEDNLDSVFIPAFNILEYHGDSAPDKNGTRPILSVVFLKSFDKVTSSTTSIPVSDLLMEPILAYIAYLAFSGIIQEGETPSNSYYKRYLAALDRARAYDVQPTDEVNENKLFNRGFV